MRPVERSGSDEMKRIGVFALPLVLGLVPAWSLQSQTGQTAEQQSQAAEQQSQTAAQQSQTAQQQSQTAQQGKASAQQQSRTAAQQSQTAAQQSQTAAQQAQTAAQQSATSQQQSQTAAQQSQIAAQQTKNAQQGQQQQSQNLPQSDQAYTAEVKAKQADRLHNSRDVLNTNLTQKLGITKEIMDHAKCAIIIPSVKRAGFVFGVDYGRGTMSCRLGENFDGPWSAPSMISLEGANFGLQIGVQVTDLVLLVMNERGVNSLLSTKSKLGVDGSVAGGPFGRSITAVTDLGMRAKMVAFSRTGGAYLGAVLNGSTLRPDNTGNTALYGRELTARQIVRSGEVPVPPAGRPLIQTLDQTKVAAATPPSASSK
jgi:SH3 domain-containing YSC84-like protein 1